MFSSQEIGSGYISFLNDFWNSSISAIQIQISFAEFKNPENPGIQPNYKNVHRLTWKFIEKFHSYLDCSVFEHVIELILERNEFVNNGRSRWLWDCIGSP